MQTVPSAFLFFRPFKKGLAFFSQHHRTEAEQQERGRFTNMASEWARLITKNTIFFNVPPKLASA